MQNLAGCLIALAILGAGVASVIWVWSIWGWVAGSILLVALVILSSKIVSLRTVAPDSSRQASIFPPDIHAEIAKQPGEIRQRLQALDRIITDTRELPGIINSTRDVLNDIDKRGSELLWAYLHTMLASYVLMNPEGHRSQHVEEAIESCRQALTVFTAEQYPEYCATTLDAYAHAYANRSSGNRADNNEKALEMLDRALPLHSEFGDPRSQIAMLSNTALMYSNRIRGDRAENLEQALTYLLRASQISGPGLEMVYLNLGKVYFERISGNRSENIENGIEFSRKCLEAVPRNQLVEMRAQAIRNLAMAYCERIEGSKADNIEIATQYAEQSLEFVGPNLPLEWYRSHDVLSRCYFEQLSGNRKENLQRALGALENIFQVISKDNDPVLWAHTKRSQGQVYRYLGRADKSVGIDQALECFAAAREILTRHDEPLDHGKLLDNLAFLYADHQQWQQCHQVSLEAIEAGKEWLLSAYSDAGRQSILNDIGYRYLRAANAALNLGRYGESLQLLDAGKAQILGGVLSLEKQLDELSESERDRLQHLRDQVSNWEYEARSADQHTTKREANENLREARDSLLQFNRELQEKHPEALPLKLESDDILPLIPPTTALVVTLFTEEWGSVMFVVPHGVEEIGEEHVIRVKDEAITLFTENLVEWLRLNRTEQNLDSLFSALAGLEQQLWTVFGEPIYDALAGKGIERLLFVPQSVQSLMPIHMACREVHGTKRYLLDDYLVTYSPSLFALSSLDGAKAGGEEAFVAGISEYSHLSTLPFAESEATSVAKLFNTSVLANDAVTADAFITGVRNKSYVHLACHGGFDAFDPFASALFLGNDEVLSLADIVAKLDLGDARLVVLSACETGLVDIEKAPNEFIGLTAGLMQAGARSVISALWSVSDESTAFLMERLYEFHLQEGRTPAEALREAQLWLKNATSAELGEYFQAFLRPRMSQAEAADAFVQIGLDYELTDKPFAHPIFWAAFTFNGHVE